MLALVSHRLSGLRVAILATAIVTLWADKAEASPVTGELGRIHAYRRGNTGASELR